MQVVFQCISVEAQPLGPLPGVIRVIAFCQCHKNSSLVLRAVCEPEHKEMDTCPLNLNKGPWRCTLLSHVLETKSLRQGEAEVSAKTWEYIQ
jgi:hypothetical protein